MLMQRGSTWYFRRTIPLALRPLMEGKRELWRSLRTSDLNKAKLLSLREGQEVERLFQDLRKQAEIAQAQIELGVSLEVRQAVTNMVNAKSTLEVAQSQVPAEAETYRLAQVRLQAGEGTSLEVSTALTALVEAQNGLANARYNYLTAYAQLQRAVASDDPNAVTLGQGTGTNK